MEMHNYLQLACLTSLCCLYRRFRVPMPMSSKWRQIQYPLSVVKNAPRISKAEHCLLDRYTILQHGTLRITHSRLFHGHAGSNPSPRIKSAAISRNSSREKSKVSSGFLPCRSASPRNCFRVICTTRLAAVAAEVGIIGNMTYMDTQSERSASGHTYIVYTSLVYSLHLQQSAEASSHPAFSDSDPILQGHQRPVRWNW